MFVVYYKKSVVRNPARWKFTSSWSYISCALACCLECHWTELPFIVTVNTILQRSLRVMLIIEAMQVTCLLRMWCLFSVLLIVSPLGYRIRLRLSFQFINDTWDESYRLNMTLSFSNQRTLLLENLIKNRLNILINRTYFSVTIWISCFELFNCPFSVPDYTKSNVCAICQHECGKYVVEIGYVQI
jgi:hypothetical protein